MAYRTLAFHHTAPQEEDLPSPLCLFPMLSFHTIPSFRHQYMQGWIEKDRTASYLSGKANIEKLLIFGKFFRYRSKNYPYTKGLSV